MLEVLRRVGFTPRSCVWELTLACNLRCGHCGSIAGARRSDELTRDELFDVADQLVRLGCRRVTLSGGEPTLHPHWHEVGQRLARQGARVNLISNGWSWNERCAQLAIEAGLCAAAFSLDGWQKEHDALRQEGSFERVVRAIEVCVASGLPVAVNTTITRLNQHLLPELYPFLQDHGVFSWQLQFATPTGNMGQHRDWVVAPEDLLWLVPAIAELCQRQGGLRVEPSDDIGYYGVPEAALRGKDPALPFWLGCRAGCQLVGIESNGNVKGCLSLPSAMNGERQFVQGNLRESRLEAIWNRPDAFAANRTFDEQQLKGFCRVCRYRDVCRGGCTWTRYTLRQSSEGNPYCFYHQAVRHGRTELIGEEPTAAEREYFFKAR
ncbi:MAG: radical SAM protein [Deltaproteobacteria bacterium]|nr:radical SAM protein [Deltaproteobacteria bacterium]